MNLIEEDHQLLALVLKLYIEVPPDVREVWWKPLICSLPITQLLELLEHILSRENGIDRDSQVLRELRQSLEALNEVKEGRHPSKGHQAKEKKERSEEKVAGDLIKGAYAIIALCSENSHATDKLTPTPTPTPTVLSQWTNQAQELSSEFTGILDSLERGDHPSHFRLELHFVHVNSLGKLIKAGLITPAAAIYREKRTVGSKNIEAAADRIVEKLQATEGENGQVDLNGGRGGQTPLIREYVDKIKKELESAFVYKSHIPSSAAEKFMSSSFAEAEPEMDRPAPVKLRGLLLGVLLGGSICLEMLLPFESDASASAASTIASLGEVSRRYHKLFLSRYTRVNRVLHV